MSYLLYRLGFAIRESGQALDRLGCRLQGIAPFTEECEPLLTLGRLTCIASCLALAHPS